MIALIVRRLMATLVLVSLLSFVLFALLQAMPGSMEDMLLSSNPNTRPEDVARLKRIRGLNKPLYEQYRRWMFGYFDRTGGQDEITLSDGSVLEGRLVDDTGDLAKLEGWTVSGATAVLDSPPKSLRFLVSGAPQDQEARYEADRVHTIEGATRIVRRQTDLGRPMAGAHLFKPSVGDGDVVTKGDELGVLYAVDESTMVALGSKPLEPEPSQPEVAIDPTEALSEAGSKQLEGEEAVEPVPSPKEPVEKRQELTVAVSGELGPPLPAPDCGEHGLRVQKGLEQLVAAGDPAPSPEGVPAKKLSPLNQRLVELRASGATSADIIEKETNACVQATAGWTDYKAELVLGKVTWKPGKGLTIEPSTAGVFKEAFAKAHPKVGFLNLAIADRLNTITERDLNRIQSQLRQKIAGRLIVDAKRVGVLKAPIDGWPALMSPFSINLSERVNLEALGDDPMPLATHQVAPWSSLGLVRAGANRPGFIAGELGWSIQQERVSTLIKEAILNTLQLMGPALLLSILIALPLGILAAVRQYSWLDHGVNMGAFLGISLPVHWFGLMLIHVFAVSLGLFPVSGIQTPGVETFADRFWYTVLPATVLSIAYIGRWLRYMRASMLEVIRQDYIRTARAKGLSEKRVIFVHALRNALIPVVTILAMSVPVLFSGALITETVFSWPGMGSLIFNAIITSDYYVAIVGFLISATLVMLGNLLADILYAVIDPRVRLG